MYAFVCSEDDIEDIHKVTTGQGRHDLDDYNLCDVHDCDSMDHMIVMIVIYMIVTA